MKELVHVLVKAIVDEPSQVSIEEKVSPGGEFVYEVRVAPDDMGKVIGKQGRIVKAIRTVVKAAAAKAEKRATVEVVQ